MRFYPTALFAAATAFAVVAACSSDDETDDSNPTSDTTTAAGTPGGSASGAGTQTGTATGAGTQTGTTTGAGTGGGSGGVGGAGGLAAGGAGGGHAGGQGGAPECLVAGDCDDGNVCTVDDCLSGNVCSRDGTGVRSPCDDGQTCLRGDRCAGDAAGSCTGYSYFNVANLPLTIAGGTTGSSNLAFDLDGHLLVPVETGDLVRVHRATGAVTTVATGLGYRPVSVAVHPSDGTIYLGKDTGEILEIDPSSGASTALANLGTGNDVNGLEIAPPGFGSFGGHLIAVTNASSGLYAIDPSNPTPVVIASQNGSDLAFSASGVLYVADWSGSAVVTVSATGTINTVTTGISNPEGVHVDDTNNRLLVASAISDTLYQVALPGGAVTSLTSLDCRSGFWPCGMADDQFGRVLIASGESNLTIRHFDMVSDPCVQ
ncbi:MAG: hypothetical protein JRI23_14955 [Deltaproteobacteria bacterium]|jgi:hypothetical protein|nr:hypothetical protein [Deltaproteobacteria bacterium]MBW2533049.1 hypothetical protein [Deltaproteobacteria bacterium]